jgi:4-hydroxythreonine-4-phosphate dehydrogenase
MHISHSIKPRVCITTGYPAGIGPEITLKALASPSIRRLANFLVVGDECLFNQSLGIYKRRILYKKASCEAEIDFSRCGIIFFDISDKCPGSLAPGEISSSLGARSISYIKKGVSLIKSGHADMLVTAPINKHAADLSGFTYKGHTEFLTYLTDISEYAMMLKSDKLKVVLASTHVPVRDISKTLNQDDILNKLVIMDSWLRHYFRVKNPKIAVCGLNPHAGDNGLIGDEEGKIIIPAISRARKKRINAIGPLAADAVFYDLLKKRYDAVLCMYHDQGLVALKMAGRNSSVNITLGLPFIRTSPGHGTALDIAGKGIADPSSMKQAIKAAVDMYLMDKGAVSC